MAIGLLEACPYSGSRILSFIGGACTFGPGAVVGNKLMEVIRSFLDLQKENENCKYFKRAQKYYQSLAQKAIKANLVIDLYAFNLDQFGLLEMKSLSEKTGGYVIVNESFTGEVFKSTYKKVFEKDANSDLKLASAAKMDVFLSRDLQVSGAIGLCTTLKKAGPSVSDIEIGQGGTTSWYYSSFFILNLEIFFLL